GEVTVEALVHARFAGVAQPHARRAAVGREAAEVPVREGQAPGARGQALTRVQLEAAVRQPAPGTAPRAPGLRQGRSALRGRLRLRPRGPGEVNGKGGAFQDVLRAGAGGRVDPAGRAQHGLQAVPLQQLRHGAGEAAEVVPALAGEEDEVAPHAADAQQVLPAYELARGAQLVFVLQQGADDGQVAGDADAPEGI